MAKVAVGEVIQEARFFDVSHDDVKPPKFEVIEIARGLAAELESSQMLVLGGHKLEDKKLFARHLAWNLCKKLGRSIPVKQWNPGLAPQNFDDALRQFSDETILLFPGVRPALFGHDLRRLQTEVCNDHKHYAIVTTDSQLSDWGSGDLERRLWHEPKTEEIYSTAFLKAMLDHELKSSTITWRSQYSREDVARRLKAPGRVRAFAFLVKARKNSIDTAGIENILQQLSDDVHQVGRWDRQLDPQLRSLALALSMLDGFFLVQALAALEILSAEVWRKRDQGFRDFDADDISRLGAYFQGSTEGDQKSQITCLSPKHRRAILKAAWECDQGQVYAVVPVLARIAARSGRYGGPVGLVRAGHPNGEMVQNPENPGFAGWLPGFDRRLFGSPERVQQAQWAVSVTLSEIGKWISFEAVENVLLTELAADENRVARSVAAAALALWRERDPEEVNKPDLVRSREQFLFDTLERWCSEAFDLEVLSFVEGYTTDSFPRVRSTVALAVSYAARFDAANHLVPELMALLKRLWSYQGDSVRSQVRLHTVPWVAALHLENNDVLEFLRDTVALDNRDESFFGLARGLAAACLIQPDKVKALDIVDEWCRKGIATRAPRRGRIPPERRRLAVALLAYGWLAADSSGEDACSHAEIFDRLRQAYTKVRGTRDSIVKAMTIQIAEDLEKTEILLQDLLGLLRKLKPKENDLLISELRERYFRERRDLPGSDVRLAFQGLGQFQLWTDPDEERPLTPMEQVLARWLLDRTRKPAVRFALRTLIALSEHPVEIKERELREKVRKERENGNVEDEGEESSQSKRKRASKKLTGREFTLASRPVREPLFLAQILRKISVFLAACFSRDRAIVQVHLAELLGHGELFAAIVQKPRESLVRIYARYDSSSERLERIVDHLVRSVWVFRYRWPVVAVIGLLLAALGINIWVYWG